MRSSRFVAIFSVLGVLAAQACVDDDSSPTPGLPDASGLDAQAPDAPVVLPQQDASVVPDADADAGVQGPVTVIITDEAKTPVPGVKIVFYDALGAPTVEVTGADGKAAHTMGPGGSVLVAEARAGGDKRLTSILGVEPFETLDVAGGEPLDPGAPFATLDFATTDVAPFVGATQYEITAGCNSVSFLPTTTLDMTVSPSCVIGGKVALLVIARNALGKILACAVKEVTSVTLNATVAVPDVVAVDWTAAAEGTFTITGAKPAHVADGHVETTYLKNQQAFLDLTTTGIAASFTALAFPRPPTGFADLFVSLVSISFEDGPDGGAVSSLLPLSTVVKQIAPPAAFPVGGTYADFLPRVHSATVSGTGSPVITWASDAPMSPVGGFAKFVGTIALDGDSQFVEWTVVFPTPAASSSGTVTLPPLPASLVEFQPTQTVAIDSMALVDSPELASYKNFRAGFGAYTGLVYDVAFKLPPTPLTARVSGVRFQD